MIPPSGTHAHLYSALALPLCALRRRDALRRLRLGIQVLAGGSVKPPSEHQKGVPPRIDHGGSAASDDAALKSPSTRSLRRDLRPPSRRLPPAPPGSLPPEPVPLTLLTSAPPHQPAAPPHRPGLPRWWRALLESARSMNIPRASLEPTGLRQNRQVLVIFSFALPYLPPQVLAGGLLGGSRTFYAETCLIFPINFHLRASPLNLVGKTAFSDAASVNAVVDLRDWFKTTMPIVLKV